MQICALDSTGSFIYADQAGKHQNYWCLECGQTLRLRHGIHRQAHYYHLQSNRICKQHAKGMPHLMLQKFLQESLPQGEADLEYRFQSIGRIADVAWHEKRIIFEIQCSPISAEEVKKRNKDYASIGYHVIWIFHDDRYNQSRLSSAEASLHHHPHYFTNMNANGDGKIYDQFAIIANGMRVRRYHRFSIDPTTPKILNNHSTKLLTKIPPIFHQRLKTWPLSFSGDTIDCLLNPEFMPPDIKDHDFTDLKISLLDRIKYALEDRIIRPYLAVLKLILERACG